MRGWLRVLIVVAVAASMGVASCGDSLPANPEPAAPVTPPAIDLELVKRISSMRGPIDPRTYVPLPIALPVALLGMVPPTIDDTQD